MPRTSKARAGGRNSKRARCSRARDRASVSQSRPARRRIGLPDAARAEPGRRGGGRDRARWSIPFQSINTRFPALLCELPRPASPSCCTPRSPDAASQGPRQIRSARTTPRADITNCLCPVTSPGACNLRRRLQLGEPRFLRAAVLELDDAEERGSTRKAALGGLPLQGEACRSEPARPEQAGAPLQAVRRPFQGLRIAVGQPRTHLLA